MPVRYRKAPEKVLDACSGVVFAQQRQPVREAGRLYTTRWATSAREYGVTVERSVKIRMPDGVHLDAEIYRPSTPGKFPVILGISPYPHHHQSAQMLPVGFT